MKVLLHTTSQGQDGWKDESCKCVRIPIAGEYLAPSSGSLWYQVQLVVHTPFSGDYEAEVYAVEADVEEKLEQILAGGIKEPWVGRMGSGGAPRKIGS